MVKLSIRRSKKVLVVAVCLVVALVFTVTAIIMKRSSGRGDPSKKETAIGEPGVVALSGEKLAASGIELMSVARESAAAPLMATAAIELNADRTSKISSRVVGRILSVAVSQGDRVRGGQPLAFIDTVELDQIWSEYRKNKGRYELALKNVKREEVLFEKNVAPEKDVLKARQELGEAEADLTFSRERFRLLGIDLVALENRKNGNAGIRPLIPITSSVGGVVIEKSVTQGEIVNPDKQLFVVADLSTLWVLVDIYEKDMPRLKTGAVVHASVNAFPTKEFRGKISYIGDVVDQNTRTVKARVSIDNSSGFLKPGMFATVSVIYEKDAQADKVIAVPEEAVLIDGPDRYVFVRIGEGRFKRRDVVTGRPIGKKIEVSEGLKEGDVVVIKGTFPLKSEYKKQSLRAE
jgi:membrane fusion protein, heavy metal efflux system